MDIDLKTTNFLLTIIAMILWSLRGTCKTILNHLYSEYERKRQERLGVGKY